MDNKKNDAYFAIKAIEQINVIEKYLEKKTYEEFLSDDQLIDAVMFRLIQMVENVKSISLKFKEDNKQIPWGKIVGFRNGIVHEYDSTDYTIVYKVITNNLPSLKDVLEKIKLD